MEGAQMTVKQIATNEGVGERQIQRYISEGFKGHKLPAVRVGRSFQITEQDYRAWRVLCGFDAPAKESEPASTCPGHVEEPPTAEESPVVVVPMYPPWPQAADPNGVLTNQPHEHSRNWPHPLAVADHQREENRKMEAQLRGYPDDNEN